MNLLAVLEQNPGADWRTLIGSVDLSDDHGDDMSEIPGDGSDDELTSFKL